MQIGFEVTAATPKRLRAAEDAPAAETMRGERRITQAPSTDQKKVRRQMQRKTAATFSAGECRMCEGPLIPMGRSGETLKAQCQDCGTKHELQNAEVKKSGAQRFTEFQSLSAEAQRHIKVIAWWHEHSTSCPECGTAHQIADGWADGRDGLHMMLRCTKCQHQHKAPAQSGREDDYDFAERKKRLQKNKPGDVGRTAASQTAWLLNFVGSTWAVESDTSRYAHTGMSAIARRAQSVLDTEESS